jgi:magnesium-transporting ATPase (P-type)
MGGGAATGFLPWIIFWVVSSPSTWKVAAWGALLAAVLVAIPDAARPGGIKALDLGTVAFFAVVSILALVLDRKEFSWFEDWSQFISSMVLAAIAFTSLAFTPFTEQYARDSTPRELWNAPAFKRINRQLTASWGVVFFLTAISGVLAVKGSHSTRDLFTWILPIVLIVGALKLQAWYIEYSRAHVGAQAPAGASAAAE